MELNFLDNNKEQNAICQDDNDQFFSGNGKLLITGEYFVLDGAQALALPTKPGQSLSVKYSPSFSPKLYWKSYDVNGNLWLETSFEFWRFECLDEEPSKDALGLQDILIQARKQNPHFLRDNVDVHVETKLGFPLEWGLGSSSTLIYNIAQWAYISPFELLFKTQGGSGYDIACAQSEGPILYQKNSTGPNWSPIVFNPVFSENLYFVYLEQKQNSRDAIKYYNSLRPHSPELIMNLTRITEELSKSITLEEFEFLVEAHERLVGENLSMTPVKEKKFSDYWGQVKSLGAWGGDFVLISSKKTEEETKKYFSDKGYNVFIPYADLIIESEKQNVELPVENELLH
jgi:mevalonate kinase